MSTADATRLAEKFTAPAALDQVQRNALIASAVGIAGCVLGFLTSPDYFFRGYLTGWVYWLNITLGCLALMMVHQLSRGNWGVMARRIFESATRTFPLLLVLAVPLFFGFENLYPWARPDEVAKHHLLEHRIGYLNPQWMGIRLAVYFLLWGGLAFFLNRLSAEQDRTGDLDLVRRMKRISGPGIVFFALAVTFFSIDWVMSLDPIWYSTIYGIYFLGCEGLGALAFTILVARFLSRREPMSAVLQPKHFHDYGKLMFAFIMLWAYFSFSQFLITWSGNLPEEIGWYRNRMQGGWGPGALAVVLFHFAIPFLLLLSRDLKRRPDLLVKVAGWMMLARLLDLFWQIEPGFPQQNRSLWWMYLAGPLAIGGLWLFVFCRELKKRPLLPVNEPYLAEAVAHEHAHH